MKSGFLYYLFLSALSQNFVLMTGFGSSLVIRIAGQKRDKWLFGVYLTAFSLAMAVSSYFLDGWLDGYLVYKQYLRPVAFVGVTVVLYILVAVFMWGFFLSFYRRCKGYMSLAAFNNILLGVALIANRRFAMTLPELIGFSLGSSIGFMLLLQLFTFARPHLNSKIVPAAFRGLPVSLIYFGLLCLALSGFGSVIYF